MDVKNIFEGWEDGEFSKALTYLICGLVLGLSILLTLSGTITTNVFLYLTLMSIIIIGTEFLDIGNMFGTRNDTIIGYIIGIAIGLAFGLGSRNGSYSLILVTQSLLNLGDLNFLFVGIIAPIVEPLFFRGVIYPIVLQIIAKSKSDANWKQKVIATLISAYLFGFYHVFAYYQNTGGNFFQTFEYVSYAAFFGVLFIGATTFMQSVSIEIGWHFVNNLFALNYPVVQIIPTIVAFSIGFFAIVSLISKKWGNK